jgi:hypothetical protein
MDLLSFRESKSETCERSWMILRFMMRLFCF